LIRRIIICILISITLAACAGQSFVSAQARYTVIPETIRPGDPVTIAINFSAADALLIADDKQAGKAVFFPVTSGQDDQNRSRGSRSSGTHPTFMAAILTIPNTLESSEAVIRLDNESGIVLEIPIKITPREFRTGVINVTPSLSRLLTTPDPQRTIESNRLWEILNTTGDTLYHQDKFILPVTSTRRTSLYGARRVNQYPDGRRTTEIHAGVDFGIPTGTNVFACGRGMVILSRHRIITGYTVIIEHAPGVYSLYYHLDSVIAEEDTIVEAGTLIGLSGSTGFSTGPHLHWEIRVNAESTYPDAFVSRPLIDKDLIISKIFN